VERLTLESKIKGGEEEREGESDGESWSLKIDAMRLLTPLPAED